MHPGEDGPARSTGDGCHLCRGEPAHVHQGYRDALRFRQRPERGFNPAVAEAFKRCFGGIGTVGNVGQRAVKQGRIAARMAAPLITADVEADSR